MEPPAAAAPSVPAASAKAEGAAAAVGQKVIAEVAHQEAPLTVQVTDLQRVTPDTLRVEIALINTSQAPEPLDVVRVLTRGQPSSSLTAGDLCLITADGSRRLFVLRDEANAPRAGGGFEPLRAGERRLVWALFPSPAPDASTVSVQVAGTLLRDVPIAPAPTGTRSS